MLSFSLFLGKKIISLSKQSNFSQKLHVASQT